jgi:protein-arginine kinase activator protein McsA
MAQVTCTNCGWVHFAVSREHAEGQVKSFNDYVKTIPVEKHKEFWGGNLAAIEDYESCKLCGSSYKDMRAAKPGDCPDGCTIGPIISEDV